MTGPEFEQHQLQLPGIAPVVALGLGRFAAAAGPGLEHDTLVALARTVAGLR